MPLRVLGVLVLVCVGLPIPSYAQFGVIDPWGPRELKQATWQLKATVVYALPALLARGEMPVVDRTGMGPTAPSILSLARLADGKALWSTPVAGEVPAMDLVDDVMLITTGWPNQTIVGISITDGGVLWEQPTNGRVQTGWQLSAEWRQRQWFSDLHASSSGVGGAFLCLNGKAYVCVANAVYCMQPSDGSILWTQQLPGFAPSLSCPLTGVGNLVLAATRDGVQAMDDGTGEVAWSAQVQDAKRIMPVGDDLYMSNSVGTCRANPSTGDVLWSLPLPADDTQTVHVCGPRVVIVRNSMASIVERETGKSVREIETGNRLGVVSGGMLLTCAKDGTDLECMRVEDGTTAWTQSLGAKPWRIVCPGPVVLCLSPGWVGACDLPTGKLAWERTPAQGTLIDSNVWGLDHKRVALSTGWALYVVELETGTCIAGVPGQFMGMAWMQLNKNILLIQLPPMAGSGGIVGIQIAPPEPPAAASGEQDKPADAKPPEEKPGEDKPDTTPQA